MCSSDLRFDVVSTVSGGGYIGGMLGRLFTRVRHGEQVIEALAGVDTRWFLWWLRANGRYLVPRGPSDSLFALAIFVRNLMAIHLELGLAALLLGCLLTGFNLSIWWMVQGMATLDPSWIPTFGLLPAWLPTLWLMVPIAGLAAGFCVGAHWALNWVARSRPLTVWAGWLAGAVLIAATLGFQLLAGGVVDDATARGVRRGVWLTMDVLLLTWLLGVPVAAWRLWRQPPQGSTELHIEAARSVLTQQIGRAHV